MKNFIQAGDTMVVVAAAAVASGGVVVANDTAGVAVNAAALGEEVVVALEGVYTLPKLASGAIGQGAKVYWDATPGEVTTTDTGNTYLGTAHAAAADGATSINVRLG